MKALASIFLGDDDAAWLVTATPSEAAEAVTRALRVEDPFVHFTLGNESEWNGKPLYLDPRRVSAISPPKSQDEDDDE